MSVTATRVLAVGVASVLLAVTGLLLGGAAGASAASPHGADKQHVDPVTAKYDKAMNRIGGSFAKGIGEIYPLLSGTKGSAARAGTIKRLSDGSKTLKGVESALKGMNPPKPIRKLHLKLTGEVSTLRGEMLGMIHSLRKNDVSGFMRGSGVPAVAKIDAIIGLMHSDGYAFLGKTTQLAPCTDLC